MSKALNDITAVILAGGQAIRLRSVLPDLPKILAPVAGRPFFEHQLDLLEQSGARHVVLSLGHRSDQVIDYLRLRNNDQLDIGYTVESQPMGTGGGLRQFHLFLGGKSLVRSVGGRVS